jgi:hypothetical protein
VVILVQLVLRQLRQQDKEVRHDDQGQSKG